MKYDPDFLTKEIKLQNRIWKKYEHNIIAAWRRLYPEAELEEVNSEKCAVGLDF